MNSCQFTTVNERGTNTIVPTIQNSGHLMLVNCLFVSNRVHSVANGADALGSAVRSSGHLILENTIFDRNEAWGRPGNYPGLPKNGGNGSGAAVYSSAGSVSIRRCQFLNNRVYGGNGGGCQSCLTAVPAQTVVAGAGGKAAGAAVHVEGGSIEIVDSLFAGNQAVAGSGGVGHSGGFAGAASGGALSLARATSGIVNCTFSANQVLGGDGGSTAILEAGGVGSGGAIWTGEGLHGFTNCTVSGNQALGGLGSADRSGSILAPGGHALGGAITVESFEAGSRMALVHSTVASNRAVGHAGEQRPGGQGSAGEGRGGGVFIGSGAIHLASTILSGNTVVTGEVTEALSDGDGVLSQSEFNLVSTTNRLSGFSATDRLGVDPLLGPLQDNGGLVQTHALLAGSLALDAGRNLGITVDARGQARTIDISSVPNAAGGDGTDIGALEVDPVLRVTEIRRSGDDLILRFTSVSDKTYGVEFKADLNDPGWTTLPGTVQGTGGNATWLIPGGALAAPRFYKVVEAAP